MGSPSQRGTLRIVPGIDIGTTDEPLSAPALPNEVPSPGLPGSTMNTSCPARCRKLAAATPIIPAPMTPTVFWLWLMPGLARLLWRKRCLYARLPQIKFCRSGFGADERTSHQGGCGRRRALAAEDE